MPDDLIPYWDYNAPGIPDEPRDVSAATVTASALYELSMYDETNRTGYVDRADRILENLTNRYRASVGKDCGFLLLHSTGSWFGSGCADRICGLLLSGSLVAKSQIGKRRNCSLVKIIEF